ncbi:MAG TPA: SDR family oxidoreductase [Alphaproteobacteria bacterium]|nr:SDR family oxidoreductase [Alphaproteobacteria bacterium]
MKLKNQVAVITGAGRNIGEETAKLLASEGARVAVADMDKGRADKVAADIKAAGGDAAGFVADVADESAVQKLVADVVAKWGRIDILVNNAAYSDNKTIFEITKAEWDKTLAITLTGPFLVGKYVAQQMVKQAPLAGVAGCKIVNVGSTSGFRGRPRAIAYTSAKGGVANLTRSMAMQLAEHNIRVNGVIPNKIGSPVGKDTFDPTRPVTNIRGRNGEPIDLAKAVLFLASDDSDFIVGDLLFVDGGYSVMME